MGKDKKNNFKTPEGYFDSFHDRLMDRIHQEDGDMESSIIPKTDGFVVPNKYFEDLTEKVVNKADKHEIKVVPLRAYKKVYYSITGIAAVLLLIFGITWNTEEPIAFEDLASTEIDAYFEATDFDFSTNEIAEIVALEQLEVEDVLDQSLAEENILEYLDENVEDIEDLNLDYEDYE